ncbi:MAG TPA: Holliday junction resolvase RuvX [Actinomycetota bacterium]|nr:Holliday junction resolvase RuvX [Actinomycetota bacterium]
MPEPGRVLALDLGDVRIGVAISDPGRRLAVPLGTIHTGAPTDLKAVASLVREHDVALVVVGHPLLLSGEAGDRARHAEAFVDALRSVLSVPVALQDERLSTVEADRALREAGASGRRRRAVVDRSAATVILQAYLDALPRP